MRISDWSSDVCSSDLDVVVVGTEHAPNLEVIAALRPDLIIGNKSRQEEVYQQLFAIAPTVFSTALRGRWQENLMVYEIGRASCRERVCQDVSISVFVVS